MKFVKTAKNRNMIKQVAWNNFINTGSINDFLQFKELEANEYENDKNEWSNNSGKTSIRF